MSSTIYSGDFRESFSPDVSPSVYVPSEPPSLTWFILRLSSAGTPDKNTHRLHCRHVFPPLLAFALSSEALQLGKGQNSCSNHKSTWQHVAYLPHFRIATPQRAVARPETWLLSWCRCRYQFQSRHSEHARDQARSADNLYYQTIQKRGIQAIVGAHHVSIHILPRYVEPPIMAYHRPSYEGRRFFLSLEGLQDDYDHS